MLRWLLRRCGSHYILVMMLLTRVFCLIGGGLVIYYVNLTMALPPAILYDFICVASVMIVFSVGLTVMLTLAETVDLRRVLTKLGRGESVDAAEGARAGREAVLYAGRHHLNEAFLVPGSTVVPICVYLWFADGVSLNLIMQITIAGFLGISTVLLSTFFASERWMANVTNHLLEHDVAIRFDDLPHSRLQLRMNVCFGLAIVVTALMIGALANQRALDIVHNPERQAEAVTNLRLHIVYILLVAVTVGVVLSRLLANSLASRVGILVEAMKRVQQGQLSERVRPTGNDEIDMLARQFNAMVEQLGANDHTIRDLNVNLEHKVKHRTRQLSRSKRSLKRSLTKLQEYDRLKTEFFSNLSHEVRTPLTMMLAPVNRILEKHRPELQPTVASMLEVVRLNGQRLLTLINRLLDFSKLEAGRMTVRMGALDLNHLANDIVMAASPLAEQRGIELTIDCDPQIAPFGADLDKVDIVISNLVSNAVKFTPSGGKIHVETLFSDDRVWVAVSDTGIGIAEEDYEKVFERFVQIDGSMSRQFSGTGLGLALSKELVELHGGQIHLKSVPGQGSTFSFDLPIADIPEDATTAAPVVPRAKALHRFAELEACDVSALETAPQPAVAANDERATVLVVDDTPEIRGMLSEILRDEYRVVAAADGVEGLAATEREHPHLIISDVMMPHVDGHEFCRRIKGNPLTARIPFVMLTSKVELDMKIDGLNCGADDYLTKPFDEKELKARVRSLIRLRKLHDDLDKRNREVETAYQDLTAMQGQLVQAEKMSSLGQLSAGLAHEINNSINAVYNGIKPLCAAAERLEGLVSPLLAGDDSDTNIDRRAEVYGLFRKVTSLANVIERGATRTVGIVTDLKTFSHPGNDGCDHFDLHASLDICLNLLFNQTKHRVAFHRQYGDVGWVYGPSGRLNQVFMNIINNAQQAITGEGEIFISTDKHDHEVSVSIRDTGAGIPEEIRSKIFDPFFTTKPPGVGTGLGLSISYGIVSQMGGSIECLSQVGQGTEFIVKFPSVPPATQKSSRTAAGELTTSEAGS